ncbi:MAG: hypothetical protein ACLUEQ_09915 [Cloacibacillus evryensis]
MPAGSRVGAMFERRAAADAVGPAMVVGLRVRAQEFLIISAASSAFSAILTEPMKRERFR